MIIRKMFKFENTHIVRGCSTLRCKSSLHGHSYKIEVLFEGKVFDNAQMIYDFGLMKGNMKDLIDSFDHSVTLWCEDDREYIANMKKHSQRWITLPLSPTAEQFARVIFVMVDTLLKNTIFVNNEGKFNLHSIIVHETDSGYAQCFADDAYDKNMGAVELEKILFSDAIVQDWGEPRLWQKLLNEEKFVNPKQV